MYGTGTPQRNYKLDTVGMNQILHYNNIWAVRHKNAGKHLCQTDGGNYTAILRILAHMHLLNRAKMGVPNATLAIQTMHVTYGVITD